MSKSTRNSSALLLATVVLISTLLHIHWAQGGRWLLSSALGVDVDALPLNLLAVAWVFVAGMLGVAFAVLMRAGYFGLAAHRGLVEVVLWFTTALMFTGAYCAAFDPRFWNQSRFAPIFLALALMSLVVALPVQRVKLETAS